MHYNINEISYVKTRKITLLKKKKVNRYSKSLKLYETNLYISRILIEVISWLKLYRTYTKNTKIKNPIYSNN